MLYEVEIVKNHPGFTKGEKKHLPYDSALHLQDKLKIGKILGEVKPAHTADIEKAVSEQDKKQNEAIVGLEERVKALEAIVLKPASKEKKVIDPKAENK